MPSPDYTPLTTSSSVFANVVGSIPSGMSFQDYIKTINGSPLLVQTINSYQSSGLQVSLNSDPSANTVKYNAGDRSLTMNMGSLASPTEFAKTLAHEIDGHDQTRDYMNAVLDPSNPMYAGLTPAQAQNAVVAACYTSENLGLIAEYRVGLQTNIDPSGWNVPGGATANIVASALADAAAALPAGTDTRIIDLAAARDLVPISESLDGGHAVTCANWARSIVPNIPTAPGPVSQIISDDVSDDKSSLNLTGAQLVGTVSFNANGTETSDFGTASGEISASTTTASGATSAVISGTGIYATLNNTSVTLTGNTSATVDGTNDAFTLTGANPTLTVSDGAVDSIYGLGQVHGSYGTLNLGTNAAVNLSGSDESVNGGAGNTVAFLQVGSAESLGNTFTGSGATVFANPNTSSTVVGVNTIDLSSLADITASNSTITEGGAIYGDQVLGSYDAFQNTGLGFQGTVGGTYDTGFSTSNDSLNWIGATTGDSTNGGADDPTPDLSPDPAVVVPDDPIILNLSGGAVQTQDLSSSTAYFDIQNNGTPDYTGWGVAGEGYLVYDPGNTNTVRNEQGLVPSFSALQALDSNHDGVLNSLDAAWSQLKVWVDSAGNGSFAAGSLQTLGQIGISSINLNSTHVDALQNNNTILDDSTFTWNSGATGDIAGVEFNFHASSVINYTAPPPRCVHVASALPGNLVAADVKVGAMLQLADPLTLSCANGDGAIGDLGEVTYSKRVTAQGVRIVTQSGISLVCSDTAPIPTPEGLVLAPLLRGRKVPTRLDDRHGNSRTAWETVEVVESIGEIEVQHITVGDKCFWAGEVAGAYILHHNLKKDPLDVVVAPHPSA